MADAMHFIAGFGEEGLAEGETLAGDRATPAVTAEEKWLSRWLPSGSKMLAQREWIRVA